METNLTLAGSGSKRDRCSLAGIIVRALRKEGFAASLRDRSRAARTVVVIASRRRRSSARVKRTIKRKDRYFVYIVQCKNGTYYTGYTHDLEKRVALHNSGRGAKYLRGKQPVRLVYAKEYVYYKNALNEERRIKKLSRSQKEKLAGSHKER